MPLHKLSKREMAAYALLLGMGETDLGVAVEAVRRRLCTTKRTARRIVKRLRRLGLVESRIAGDRIIVRPRSPEEVLESLLEEYSAQRRARCYALAKMIPEGEDQSGR